MAPYVAHLPLRKRAKNLIARLVTLIRSLRKKKP
jgi:hypothetical protein